MSKLDRENRKARHVNPSNAGIRSGNPQLDPERAKKQPEQPGQQPHRPEVEPKNKRAPNR
jgi:hypothetical protein